MNNIKALAAVTALAGTPIASNAEQISLAEFSSMTNCSIKLEYGVATLYGHVPSQFESVQAENAAQDLEGVVEVRNYVTYSS